MPPINFNWYALIFITSSQSMQSNSLPYLSPLVGNLFQIQLQQLRGSQNDKDWVRFTVKFVSSAFKMFGGRSISEIEKVLKRQMCEDLSNKSLTESNANKQSPVTTYLKDLQQRSDPTMPLALSINYICLLLLRTRLLFKTPPTLILSKLKSAQLTLMFTNGACLSEVIIEHLSQITGGIVDVEGWEKIVEVAKAGKFEKLQKWTEDKIKSQRDQWEAQRLINKESLMKEDQLSQQQNHPKSKLKKKTLKKNQKTIPKISPLKQPQVLQFTPPPRQSLPRTLFQTGRYTFKSSRKKQPSPQIVYVVQDQITKEQHNINNISEDDLSENLSKLRMKTPQKKTEKEVDLSVLAEGTPPKTSRKSFCHK